MQEFLFVKSATFGVKGILLPMVPEDVIIDLSERA